MQEKTEANTEKQKQKVKPRNPLTVIKSEIQVKIENPFMAKDVIEVMKNLKLKRQQKQRAGE